MNKPLSVLIILLLLFFHNYALAGDDGKIKLNGNNNGYLRLKTVLKKLIGEYFHLTRF